MNLKDTLSKNSTLWLAFIATILLTFSFQVAVGIWDLTMIDAISDPAETRLAIASMSSDQHVIHAWITGTLDVAYPLAYGALFIGSGYKFYGKWGWLVAAPAYVVIPVDLLEGVVQVLALTNVTDWLDAKAILTPLKTVLFLIGLLTTIVGWIIWLISKLRRS